jgi:uncharacterized membrane protein required for colicin V production
MAEFIANLNWIDLFIVIVLAGSVFAGWTQGLIRYLLSGIGVVVAFVLASQLKGPTTEALGFWTAFDEPVKELWVFVFLFIGLTIAAWFLVRALYRRTRLPIARQLDELGGAVLGLLFAVIFIVLLLVVMDTFFQDPTLTTFTKDEAGVLKALYDVMNDSLLVGVFRQLIIPTVGFFARPFVPAEIREFLHWP